MSLLHYGHLEKYLLRFQILLDLSVYVRAPERDQDGCLLECRSPVVGTFLGGPISQMHGWGYMWRGGEGTNMASICAGTRLTPHLGNICLLTACVEMAAAPLFICFSSFFFLIAPFAPRLWKPRRGSDSSPLPRDVKLSEFSRRRSSWCHTTSSKL